jgi:hypothetical protein
MRQGNFSFKIMVDITISKEEVEYLIKVSERHYDLTCKQAGRPGGFIYGWKNRFYFNRITFDRVKKEVVEGPEPTEATITTDFAELDTVAKILEMEQMPLSDNKLMFMEIVPILNSINRQDKRVNEMEELKRERQA